MTTRLNETGRRTSEIGAECNISTVEQSYFLSQLSLRCIFIKYFHVLKLLPNQQLVIHDRSSSTVPIEFFTFRFLCDSAVVKIKIRSQFLCLCSEAQPFFLTYTCQSIFKSSKAAEAIIAADLLVLLLQFLLFHRHLITFHKLISTAVYYTKIILLHCNKLVTEFFKCPK